MIALLTGIVAFVAFSAIMYWSGKLLYKWFPDLLLLENPEDLLAHTLNGFVALLMFLIAFFFGLLLYGIGNLILTAL